MIIRQYLMITRSYKYALITAWDGTLAKKERGETLGEKGEHIKSVLRIFFGKLNAPFRRTNYRRDR
jgi:hypothetical protein